MWKRTLALVTTLSLTFGLAGCGGSPAANSTASSPSESHWETAIQNDTLTDKPADPHREYRAMWVSYLEWNSSIFPAQTHFVPEPMP